MEKPIVITINAEVADSPISVPDFKILACDGNVLIADPARLGIIAQQVAKAIIGKFGR
jgi:hypothetical protein